MWTIPLLFFNKGCWINLLSFSLLRESQRMFHNWFVFHDLQSKAEPNETEKNE